MAVLPSILMYMEPTLRALGELGGAAGVAEINERVAAQVGLTREQLELPHGRGDRRTEFEYRAAWARTRLRKAGKIEPVGRGRWRLEAAADPDAQ